MQLLVVQHGTVFESVSLTSGSNQLRGVWKGTILVIVIKHQARDLDFFIISFSCIMSSDLTFLTMWIRFLLSIKELLSADLRTNKIPCHFQGPRKWHLYFFNIND